MRDPYPQRDPLTGYIPIDRAVREEMVRLRAELERVTAERDRYRQHSVTFNTVVWRIALALGDVPDGAEEVSGNPVEQVERLIAERDRYRLADMRLRVIDLHREEVTAAGRVIDADRDLLDAAWGLIANAGEGNWENETVGWRLAAQRWRDSYHERLAESRDLMAAPVGLDTRTGPLYCGAVGEHIDKPAPTKEDTHETYVNPHIVVWLDR